MDEETDKALKKAISRAASRAASEVESSFYGSLVTAYVIFMVTTLVAGGAGLVVELIRSLWRGPWLQMGIYQWATIALLLFLTYAAAVVYVAVGAARIFKKVLLVPLAWIAFILIGIVWGTSVRTLTIGKFVGDVMGIAFYPVMLGIGAIKAVLAMSTPAGESACKAFWLAGFLAGPETYLGTMKRLTWFVLEYAFLPWKHNDLRNAALQLGPNRGFTDQNWQSSLNVTTYGMSFGYLSVCAAKGAFANIADLPAFLRGVYAEVLAWIWAIPENGWSLLKSLVERVRTWVLGWVE